MFLYYFIYILVLSICLTVQGNNADGNQIKHKKRDHTIDRMIPYTISKGKLTDIRKKFMYPFESKSRHDDEGDFQRDIVFSNPQIHKNLNFNLPFFGFRYNYTRISVNGYLEFSDSPSNYQYPLVFPVKEWPKKNDPAFIGIFYSKCKIGNIRDEEKDKRPPGVYFRMERNLNRRQDKSGVELRERLMWDIREGIIGSETFSPKHAIIVTWKNVSFSGGINQALYHTNTFQMVIATDEVFTYAIFNYLDLNWTSHTEAGGDTLYGEGGVPAFVGFNAGNGTRSFQYMPFSQSSTIRDLTTSGYGNGFPGRHIFRIDENILTGSCLKDIDGNRLPLILAPEMGNMLGGTIVNITGPCFNQNDKIKCKFGISDEVVGYVIDKNRAICVQPQLYDEGWIDLRIAINSEYFRWSGKYFVETPARATETIFLPDRNVDLLSPDLIPVRWNQNNLTINHNARVRISLWGYHEIKNPTFSHVIIADDLPNTGQYNIDPTQYSNRNDSFLTNFKFGFLQITLTEPLTLGISPVLWSRPIPLGWYFKYQWNNLLGPNYIQDLCKNWINQDVLFENFINDLPQCPCTLEQALADRGKFMPDFDCDKDSYPNCIYNKGAIHCVKTGLPTIQGSEQQCCYDRNNYLMLSQDQMWGSSPSRSHNLGKFVYNKTTNAPSLSQWSQDIVPKYLCCLWQHENSDDCITLRTKLRPTQDCVAYEAPGIAGVYGDPHIITFDDVEYTFNGKGEFVLVRSEDFKVQGRFEQMKSNAYGEVKATQLTSIVARGSNIVNVVEVRNRPKHAKWRYRLDVIVDNRKLYFDTPSLKVQHFENVTVYTPTYILNQSTVLIMFDNGAGVEVVENLGFMTARVFLPRSLMNKTIGLFGTWNSNKEDDFTLPDGSKVPTITSFNDTERIYYDFGLKWMLDDRFDHQKGISLFYRDFGRTSATFNNKTFKPEFRMLAEDILPPNRSESIQKAYDICLDSYQCRYDYVLTLNKNAAQFTKNYQDEIYQLKRITKKKINSCGVLQTPKHGRKSTFLFVPGTRVLFECDEGFLPEGDQRRMCEDDGSWNSPIYGYTRCSYQSDDLPEPKLLYSDKNITNPIPSPTVTIPTKPQSDEWDAFGIQVAQKIKKLKNEKTKVIVSQKIFNYLSDALLNEMDN